MVSHCDTAHGPVSLWVCKSMVGVLGVPWRVWQAVKTNAKKNLNQEVLLGLWLIMTHQVEFQWNLTKHFIIIISQYFTYISQFAMLTPYTAMGQQPPCHEDHVMQELEAECARLRQMVETGAGVLRRGLVFGSGLMKFWGGSTIENFKITCRCFLFVKKLRPVSLATRNV